MMNNPVSSNRLQSSNSSTLQSPKNNNKIQRIIQDTSVKNSKNVGPSRVSTSPRATAVTINENKNFSSQVSSFRQTTKQMESRSPPKTTVTANLNTQPKSPKGSIEVKQAIVMKNQKNANEVKIKEPIEGKALGKVAGKRLPSNQKKNSNHNPSFEERGFLKSLRFFTEEEEIENEIIERPLAKESDSVKNDKKENEKAPRSILSDKSSSIKETNSSKPKLNNYLSPKNNSKTDSKIPEAKTRAWNFDSDEEGESKAGHIVEPKQIIEKEKQSKSFSKNEECQSDHQGQTDMNKSKQLAKKDKEPVLTEQTLSDQKWLKEKEEQQKTISILQEQILQLKSLLEKSLVKDEPSKTQTKTSKLNQDLFLSFHQIPFDKELPSDENNLQTDNLIKTIEALRNENQMLRLTNKSLLQFKEAAKRYRNLAKTKSDECTALTEELNEFKKNIGLVSQDLSLAGPLNSRIKQNRSLSNIESLLSGPKQKLIYNSRLGKSLGSSLSTLNTEIVIETSENESDESL